MMALSLALLGFGLTCHLGVSGRLEFVPVRCAERVEHFVIEYAHAAADEEPVGLLVLRREFIGRKVQLGMELWIAEDDVRLTHVERIEPRRTSLVWREVSRGGAALVLAEGEPLGTLDVTEWDADGRRRSSESSDGLLITPLHLLEWVRSGDVREGSFHVFDPLTRRVEWLGVASRPNLLVHWPERQGGNVREAAGTLDVAPTFRRTIEYRNADGSLRSSFTFGRDGLERWVLQEGGLVARRLSDLEWSRVARRLGGEAWFAPSVQLGGVSELLGTPADGLPDAVEPSRR